MSLITTEPPSSRRNRRWLITAVASPLAVALAAGGTVLLAGCENETTLEEGAEETGDALEEGADEIGDAIDEAGDELDGG